jgi:TATA-binding protein-associated factor
METDQILDLFNLGETGQTVDKPAEGNEESFVGIDGEVVEKGKKPLLEDVGELWDDRQYEEEYNLDSFLASMKA